MYPTIKEEFLNAINNSNTLESEGNNVWAPMVDKSAMSYGADWKTLVPVFVDLYIMKYSRCVSYGRLGFGAFGARLSGGECVIRSGATECPSH